MGVWYPYSSLWGEAVAQVARSQGPTTHPRALVRDAMPRPGFTPSRP